jgi:hypothetical protein
MDRYNKTASKAPTVTVDPLPTITPTGRVATPCGDLPEGKICLPQDPDPIGTLKVNGSKLHDYYLEPIPASCIPHEYFCHRVDGVALTPIYGIKQANWTRIDHRFINDAEWTGGLMGNNPEPKLIVPWKPTVQVKHTVEDFLKADLVFDIPTSAAGLDNIDILPNVIHNHGPWRYETIVPAPEDTPLATHAAIPRPLETHKAPDHSKLGRRGGYFDSNPPRIWPQAQTGTKIDLPHADSVCEELKGTGRRQRVQFAGEPSIAYDQWPLVVCRPRTERWVGDYFAMNTESSQYFCHPERHYYACASFDDTPPPPSRAQKRLLPQTRYDWHDHDREITCHEYTSMVPRTRQILTCEPIDTRPTAKHKAMEPWQIKGRFGWYECRWLAHVEIFGCPYYDGSPENSIDDLPDRYPDVPYKTLAELEDMMNKIEEQRVHEMQDHNKIPPLQRRGLVADALKGPLGGFLLGPQPKPATKSGQSAPPEYVPLGPAPAQPKLPAHLDLPADTLILSDGPIPPEAHNLRYTNPFPQGRKYAKWEFYPVGKRTLMFCQPDPVYPDRDDLEMCNVGQGAYSESSGYDFVPWIHIYDNGEMWWCKKRGRVHDCHREGPARFPPRKQVWESFCPKNGGGRVAARTVERTVVSTVYVNITAPSAVPTRAVGQDVVTDGSRLTESL